MGGWGTLLMLIGATLAHGTVTDLFLGQETGQANNVQAVIGGATDKIGTPCYIEFQVTKRASGHCVKLGRRTIGCAAGQYLDPFHHDCM